VGHHILISTAPLQARRAHQGKEVAHQVRKGAPQEKMVPKKVKVVKIDLP
jgi:hypothetical protein